jgi:hypothetical protein
MHNAARTSSTYDYSSIYLACVLALCASCARSSASTSSGHARMLGLLERIDVEAKHKNPFLGADIVSELRSRLAALPAAASGGPPVAGSSEPSEQRFDLEISLGREELRLGHTADAIAAYQAALGEIERNSARVPPDTVGEAHFLAAVAYMRLGETNNCCRKRTSESCILPIEGGGVHTDRDGSATAIGHLGASLRVAQASSPLAIKSRWLLNLAHMTLGTWPEGVQPEWRIAPEVFASDESFPRFPDVSEQVGVGDFMLAGGAVADDFDGDGLTDLMVSDSDTHGQLRLYKQLPDHTFKDVTDEAGLKGLYGGLNLIQADYDNDGAIDVLVLRGGWWRENGCHPKSLLHNDGHGHFTDVTFEAGLGGARFPSQTASWADYDNDGYLDLYIGNETGGAVQGGSQLFHNNRDGTFTDVARAAGVANDRYSKAVHFGDYDEDGFPDIYVSNAAADNRLYHNNGDGTFTDVAESAGVTKPFSSFPAFFWDFDQDGHLDIYVGAYGGPSTMPDVVDAAASYLGLPVHGEMSALYRGDGHGHFVDVAKAMNLKRCTLAMAANFGDLDNDGRPDLYLGTGYPFYEGLVPNVMYHNRGAKGFADVTTAGGFGELQKGHGIAFADLDDDGNQDVFERVGGAYPGDAYSNVLFHNPGFGNHWLKVRLRGVRSNSFGVGARITLEIEEDGVARRIYKEVNSGGSFGGNPLRQELGTGRAKVVKTLEVWWPTSRTRQVFHDVAADRKIEIVEGESAIRASSR